MHFGNETLKIVREKSDKIIKGNKEQYLIEYEKYNYDWKNLQFRNVKFMYNELSKDNMNFIRNLPHCLEKEYDKVKILFAHGSPNSVEELLNRNKRELLEKYANEINADALIFGHTHLSRNGESENALLQSRFGRSDKWLCRSRFRLLPDQHQRLHK